MNAIVEKEVVVPVAFYLRATADLVKSLAPYRCRVTLHCDGKDADGRDIMDVMGLFVGEGSKVRIRAEGEDAQDCVEVLAQRIAGMKTKTR